MPKKETGRPIPMGKAERKEVKKDETKLKTLEGEGVERLKGVLKKENGK